MNGWADRSEQIDVLAKAWVKALGEMSDVVKTQTVSTGQYAYSYATLADALQMARPILLKHGLALSQSVAGDGDDVVVFTSVVHESGQWVTSEGLRLPAGKTAQQTGSATTYARRYSLMAFLGLASEDDDGAGASPRNARTEPARKPVKAVRNDSKGQSGQARTTEEAVIRQMMVALPEDRRKLVREAFKETFKSGLSDLDPMFHSDALSWMETYGV